MFAPATLYQLPQSLRSQQDNFSRTGGIHAAALIDHLGKARATMEDVGRHNAVDKLIGQAMLNGQLLIAPPCFATQRPRRLRTDSEGTRSRCSDGDCAWGPDHHGGRPCASSGDDARGFFKTGSLQHLHPPSPDCFRSGQKPMKLRIEATAFV